ncbi:hypothetical protein [Peptostreptococcus porci]|uniref:hypothetical protein n=1 Tax=Peptostreptococcus porci TaxID=2652282 RepID=UPI002A80F4AF|nr:hypothetical protein [Peptostreptococcus porci]MDY4127666.1 hypothetical protein [Peptostreptococcus porci]
MFITDTKGTNDSELDDEVVTSVPFNYNVTASILTGLNTEITANPDLPVVENLINELKVLGGLTLEDPNTVFGDYEKKVDVPKKTLVEDGKIYLAKSDGTKIDNGTTLPLSGGGGNVTWESLTGKPTTFTPSAHSHGKSDITDFPTIPTKTSELNNDSGFLTSHQDLSNYVQKETGKGLSTNDFTTSEKEKLQGLNNYTLPIASETVLGGVKVGDGLRIVNGVLSANGGGSADSIDWNNIQNKPSVFAPDTHRHSYNDLTEKPNIPSVVGLATESYVDTKVAEIVDSAPETLNTLNELSTALGNDPNFATTVANQIGTKASTEYVNAELAKKVSNEGYVATENNYTTAEKTKLQGIQEGANNYIHPEYHDASTITQDNMHRFITDAERQTWNNKSDFDGNYDKLSNKPTIPTKVSQLQNDSDFAIKSDLANKVDKVEGKSLSTNDYTSIDKAKLDGLIGLPSYSIAESNKILAVNASGNATEWIDKPSGTGSVKSYVTYEEFGAKSDGVYDDGVAIKLAHEHANQNNLTVKPDSTKTYYIKQAHSIPIINSTDLNNATFVIDDTVEVDRKKNVFEVKSKKEPITIVDLNFTVKRSTVKLSNLSGHGLCLVQVVNANKKQFIREGSNSNEGTDQQDYFVIDNEGSVLTDIIWDFEQITSCTLYPFDDTTLIMKNAKFITRSNGKELQTNYFDRGLTVNRSNVILENISHRVENEQPGSPYHGFISGRYCAYLTLRNCSVQSRKAYKVSGTSVWMGSYDIEMYCVVGVKLENVIDVTFDNKERWGVFASNFCKDIVVEDSTLSRVDAHQGARNITIRRSVIGNQGIRVIGSGLCLIEDSKILNNTSLITLRSDYGSSWEGILVIRRTYWKPDTTYAYPRIINFSNTSNHDFGYTCYFPRLIIDDLEVDDTELLSNGSYSNIPIINNNTAAFGTDITSFTHPYHFTDNIECKNMRTKSDKGFILFNSSTINLYNKNPFTYKVLESTSVNNKKLLIVPNTKIVLDNVKLAKVSRRMNASGNLFAILDASGNDGDGFTNNANHVLPLIHIKNCENVYAFTSNHPMVLELEDSVVSTLLNVGASTRMNGKATGCSFKPSIDGVYQSVNTNYGDFAFTDCKFDTPLVNSVEEKTPTNLVRIYSFLGSYDSAKNNYNLINTIMDNCSIWDGTRCLALGTISDTGVSNALLTEYTGGKKQRFITQQEYNSLSSTGQLDNNTVYNITDAPVGIVIKKVTQQQYDTEPHDANTLYVIVG